MMDEGKLGDERHVPITDRNVRTAAATAAHDMHYSQIARLLGCSTRNLRESYAGNFLRSGSEGRFLGDELRSGSVIRSVPTHGKTADRHYHALATLLDMEGEGKLGETIPTFPERRDHGGQIPKHGKTADKHYHALAARLGCSEGYVREHIELIRRPAAGDGSP